MSVAAQLAQLRDARGAAVARTAPPSVLLSARDAAREARVDAAGAALNALEALSAGDGALPQLAAPLLLRDARQDRTTLTPAREKSVSRAVVVVAHRLVPVFPLRAAQRVVEWIVRALDAGRVGADAEIDALLVAALPFHATQQFVRVAAALLAPPAPIRPHWRWLAPVVEQKLPVDGTFIAKHISAYALTAAVRQLASAAVAGVAIAPLASFVASAAAARFLSGGRHKVETRTLALTCLEAICFSRKQFTVVSGKREKRGTPPPSVLLSMNRAKVAYLVALSVAVSGNVLDVEVRDAVLQAAITTLSDSHADEVTRETAASCTIICLGRTDYAPMPSSLAKALSKWGGFPNALSALTDTEGVPETFCSYLSALALRAPLYKRSRFQLTDAISARWKEILTEKCIATAVCHLLDAYCSNVGSKFDVGSETFIEKKKELTDFLAPIVRGQFSTAVDAALRKHFDKRRKRKRKEYVIVDEALTEAMAGTPYVTVKTSGINDELEISEDTLLHCLEHPEPSVRLNGIQRLGDERGLIEAAQGTPLADALRGILMRRLTSDSDILIVTETLKSGLVPTFCVMKNALKAVGDRYISVMGSLSEKKRQKLSSRMLNFSTAVFGFCIMAASSSTTLRLKVLALLVGLEADEMLPAEAVKAGLNDVYDSEIMTFASRKSPKETPSFKRGLIRCALNADAVLILTALFSWDKLWGINYTKMAFESWWPKDSDANQIISTATELIELMILNSLGNVNATDEALQVAVSSLKSLPKLHESEFNALKKLWHVLSIHGKPPVIQEMIRVISITQGSQKLYEFLIALSAKQKSLHVSAFSLQWSAAILKSGCVSNGAEPFIHRLLVALYSSHAEIRRTASDICKQLDVADLGKGASERAQLIFRKLKSAVSKPELQKAQKDGEDWTVNHLQEQLVNTYPSLLNLPLPLAVINSEKGTELASAILSLIGNDVRSPEEWESCLSVLRCLQNVHFDFPAGALFVINTIERLISNEQELFATDEHIEALMRLSEMMSGTSSFLPSKEVNVKRVAKLFITCAHSLSSRALTPATALAGEIVLTGMIRCVTLLGKGNPDKQSQILSNDAVSTLFWLSTLSSPIGEFAVKLISSQIMILVVREDFERVTQHLANSVSSSTTTKRRRTPVLDRTPKNASTSGNSSLMQEDARRSSVTGVLEALARIPTPKIKKSIYLWHETSVLRNNLWSFVRSCANVVKSNDSFSLLEHEYQLSLVLRILADFYNRRESKTINLEPDDAIAAIDICFFPGTSSDVELSATARSLRASAAVLVKALAAYHSNALVNHVEPFLRQVLSVNATQTNRECLSSILPMLLHGGLDVSDFLKLSLELNPSGAIKERLNMTDCIRMCPNKKQATAAALDLLLCSTREESALMNVLPECVKALLHSGNSVDEILGVLSTRMEKKLASLVVHIFGSPEFILQLDAYLHNISQQAHAKEISKYAALNNVLVALFKRLQGSEEKSRQNAIGALMSVIPGSVMGLCLSDALSGTNKEHALQALQCLVKRYEVNNPIPDNWEGEGVSDSGSKSSEKVCELLRNFIMSFFNTDESRNGGMSLKSMNPVASELGNHALLGLSKVLMRSNRSHIEEVQRCGEALISLMETKHCSCNLIVLSSTITCLSEVVKVLGKGGSVFVPPLTSAAADIIEEALCEKLSKNDSGCNTYCLAPKENLRRTPRQGMSLALDAAIHAISGILDVIPKMFGKKSLRRITAVAAVSENSTMSALLCTAMTKVSPTQALDALAFGLKCAKSSPCNGANSVKVLMEGVVKATSKMRKTAVKSMNLRILQLCLSAMEYRSELFTNQTGKDHSETSSSSSFCSVLSSENSFSNCKTAEEFCCAAVIELVLKVPESDFKVMFNQIVSWSESNGLENDVLSNMQKLNSDNPATLLRIIPMQRLCFQLFGVLRKIFCPFYAGVLERSLKVISTDKILYPKISTHSGKTAIASNGRKRRRETMEQVDETAIAIGMEKMRGDAMRLCLRNVELFLRNSSDTDEVSAASLAKTQDSILTCFDNFGDVFETLQGALCALASRMVITGTYRTKEQSRELIVGLSRATLLRTRNEVAAMRRGALRIVSAIIDTVDEEYLVALPEAMPILADVVDDEQDDVAEVARDLVRKLEALTGEPILEQLK